MKHTKDRKFGDHNMSCGKYSNERIICAIAEVKKERQPGTVVRGGHIRAARSIHGKESTHSGQRKTEGDRVYRQALAIHLTLTFVSASFHGCRCALELPRIKNEEERELKREAYWAGIHELNR